MDQRFCEDCGNEIKSVEARYCLSCGHKRQAAAVTTICNDSRSPFCKLKTEDRRKSRRSCARSWDGTPVDSKRLGKFGPPAGYQAHPPPHPAKVFGLEWVAFAFAVSFEGWPDI